MELQRVVIILYCCYTVNSKHFGRAGMKEDEGRIVGGGFASIKKYPYSAFLSIEGTDIEKRKSNWMCGSSILNQFILLSAGHCVEDCSIKCNILATVGTVQKYKGVHHLVETFKLHEKYDGTLVVNDISLLKLKMPLKMGQTVSRVSILPNPPMNEIASLAGWGITDEENETDSAVLKYLVDIKVMDRDECIKLVEQVPEGAFCARRVKDDANYAAEGDSGSALTVRGFIQIGLVSFKNPVLSRSTIIYTDVKQYYDWISTTSKAMYCESKKKDQ